MDNVATLVLQIITISIALYSAIMTYVIHRGQNIIDVTTKYRMDRSNQLKESGRMLVSNSDPLLLQRGKDNAYKMEKIVIENENSFPLLLHRNFIWDMELIVIVDLIAKSVHNYIDLYYSNNPTELEFEQKKLESLRQLFIIKNDIYTATDWHRIKEETRTGKETNSEHWIEDYQKNICKYSTELETLVPTKLIDSAVDVTSSDSVLFEYINWYRKNKKQLLNEQ